MWEIDGYSRSFVILQTHVEPVLTGIFQFLFPIGVKNTNLQRHLGGQNDPIIPNLIGRRSFFLSRTAAVHP